MSGENLFFHVDIDAFYASVEVLDNPQYKDKPLVVGGMGRRGVVSTCSYQARKIGIHSAMPMYEARHKAPNAIFLPCRMNRYKEKSNEVMNVLRAFTTCFHQISIDEAFLDMQGMERLMGSPIAQAYKIKNEVLLKTGITVSIGGGINKYIAKIASSMSKPDGLMIIPKGKEIAFMKSIPLKKVWGLGEKSLMKLSKHNITSTIDVIKMDKEKLQTLLGISFGAFLYNAVRGGSSDIFIERKKAKSISVEHTFDFNTDNINIIDDLLFKQTDEIINRLVCHNLVAHRVFIKIIYSDFSKKQFSTMSNFVNNRTDLYNIVKKIFLALYNKKKIRLLGIGVGKLQYNNKDCFQNELFSLDKKRKQKNLEFIIKDIKDAHNNIMLARLLKK